MDSTPKSYQTDPNLYLYTSLTSGSSHIITATSRLETILKANKIPFLALDVATDERARMLWGRRAGKRKLPGLVRMGLVVGDLEEVEEWNEYGELKENIGPAPAAPLTPTPSALNTPSKAPAIDITPVTTPSKAPSLANTPSRPGPSSTIDSPLTTAMRQAGFEAARKAGDAKKASNAKIVAQAKSSGQTSVSSETLQKLDDSPSTRMPTPSGTTEGSSAKTSETGRSGVKAKSDMAPAIAPATHQFEEKLEKLDLGESNATHSWPAMSVGGFSNTDKPKGLQVENIIPEEPGAKDEEPEGDEEAEKDMPKDAEHKKVKPTTEKAEPVREQFEENSKKSSATKDATVSDEAQSLPGKKTEDQPAAGGIDAGDSVAD